jgi:hypothetical protein
MHAMQSWFFFQIRSIISELCVSDILRAFTIGACSIPLWFQTATLHIKPHVLTRKRISRYGGTSCPYDFFHMQRKKTQKTKEEYV